MGRVKARAYSRTVSEYGDVNPILLGLFCLYIVTWFLQLSLRIPLLQQIRFEFTLAAVLAVTAISTNRLQPKGHTDLYLYTFLFLLAVSVQVPFSADVTYSWTVFLNRVLKFAFMTIFIIAYVRSPTALRWFLYALLLAWFKLGLEGFVGEITGSKVWQNQGIMRLHGSTGLYAHPNSFSGFGVGLLPFIYFLFPVANKWQKAFLLVLLAFACNIVLNTGSRTGYIAFLFFALYLFMQSSKKVRWLAAFVVVAIIALQAIPEQYIGRFKSIGGKEVEGNSKVVRIVILQDAAVIFAEHPFGVGVSAFPAVREKRFGRFQDTHNLYMEVLTNLGIQGFIVWLLFIIALFRSFHRTLGLVAKQLSAMKRGPIPDPKRTPQYQQHIRDLELMRAVLLAAQAYVAIRLVFGFFGMDLYEIYWWFALGIALAIHNQSQVALRITAKFVQIEEEWVTRPRSGIRKQMRDLFSRGRIS